jgi:hypothetical protein
MNGFRSSIVFIASTNHLYPKITGSAIFGEQNKTNSFCFYDVVDQTPNIVAVNTAFVNMAAIANRQAVDAREKSNDICIEPADAIVDCATLSVVP